MYFRYYWLGKGNQINAKKVLFQRTFQTSNMVNVPKHCWYLHQSTFIRFIDHCQGNWVGKSLSYWQAKSWDCLSADWLSMTSILFLMKTIKRYQFRCSYLRNKKTFSQFFAVFWKPRLNFKHFPKKDDPHTFCIFEITDFINVVR